ncbi:hypothetical protein T310_4142 [Rasamsonia emersonii CBS 393.64]|uniref:Uncharacterized protein n=1 Tax=Rasamsonia emersonii (strain ATCC 16479 / CBS 393.64 / IMI 116815) TaxID=1408163 RepID=A0A0F4YU38_RASE3|nr:hypothetical protein T310_4142 [Rasamsonia emersonii CBS 393.64]KKA21797.1 hypothetical protein T310_4142 [Rasamsonia emersonii CBS 393.64]
MAAARGRRGWIRLVIFVALYLMLLQSLSECVLVTYLYGTGRVDGTMTPSLILGLVASFLSVPFVVFHSILSWQYKKMRGFNIPRTPLHTACSYLPRIMIVVWLASSVAGLVVVSKQATCHSRLGTHHLWQAGISCSLHRVAIVIAVLAFITACALFFSFQVCERPYDASLLGLYAPQRPPRDGSILSESTWESETLKHEIFYLCRHPDAGPGNGELYWSPNHSSIFEQPVRPPSIRYPGAARLRPQLSVNTNPASIRPEIASSPVDSSPKTSPVGDSSEGSNSVGNGVSPLSRNPSMSSSWQLGTESALTKASPPELPDVPEVPAKPKHERQKSSVSSRKFLPKTLTNFVALSEDPEIRALSSPPLSADTDSETQGSDDSSATAAVSEPNTDSSPTSAANMDSNQGNNLPSSNSSPRDPAPVLPPQPLVVRKSRTSYIEPPPRSIHHPHHPNYIPPPPRPMGHGHGHGRPMTPDNGIIKRRNTNHPIGYHPHHSVRPPRPRYPRVEPSHLPRHTQSHHYNHRPRRPLPDYPRRFHSHHQYPRFDPSRTLPPIPRCDDFAIVYPSTRRPRSSTYGGISTLAETGLGASKKAARTSLNLASGISIEEDHDLETNTYRGAERTSMHGL